MQSAIEAVILDRDGVVNEVTLRGGKPMSPRKFGDFRLVDDFAQSVRRLRALGLRVVVATNQPDLGRGLMDSRELEQMHGLLRKEGQVDEILVCPHDDRDGCGCRKPKPGLIVRAAERWKFECQRSFMVGDTWKDMEAGASVGCKTILIEAQYNADVSADFRVGSLSEAVDVIAKFGSEWGHL